MHRGWLRALPVLIVMTFALSLQAHDAGKQYRDMNPDAPADIPAPPPIGDRVDLLVEGFEVDWPPAGWAVLHLGQSHTWEATTTEQHSGLKSAWVHYGTGENSQDEYLVTSALNLSGHSSAFLEFYEMMQYWTGYGEHHYIAVSTTSQTDPEAFTMIVDWTPGNHEIPDQCGDEPVTVDLSAYVGEPVVYVAFRYVGTYADDWFIDDVRIYEPFDHDISVVEVLPDGEQFAAPYTLVPEVVVENIGQNPDTVDIRLRISESGVGVYEEIVNVPLAFTERDTIVFPGLDLNAGHYYVLDAASLLLTDGNTSNDQASAFIDTYTQIHVPLGYLHTNAGSGPCAGAEPFLDDYIEDQDGDAALIRIHTWWPNPNDAMWLANQEQNEALIYHNGFEYAPDELFVPQFWVDGILDMSDDGPDYPGAMELRKDVLCPALISMLWLADTEELVVRVDVVEPMEPSGDYRLRVAVTEDDVLFDGGNNYLWHQQVFRYMYPDTFGLDVPSELGHYTYVVSCPLNGSWNYEKLRAVAYLQDENTHRIWQAGTGFLQDLYGHIEVSPRVTEVMEESTFSLDLLIFPTDLGVKGVEVEIDFDESHVRLDSITPGEWFTDADGEFWFYDYTPSPPDSAETIHFAASFLANATSADSGRVAVCHFTATNFGEMALPFTLTKVRDLTNNELDFNTSSADSIVVLPITTDQEEAPPSALRLLGNVPNPFNPSTLVKYEIPTAGFWRLEVYDVSGRRIRTLASGWQEPGYYDEVWNGRDDRGVEMGSGLYFARLSGPAGARTNKMMLLK